MKREECRKRMAKNLSGSAALYAILIMIMLLAIGTAAVVVTGRSDISENDEMPAYAAVESEEEESSSEEDTSSVEEVPDTTMTYPEKDYDFVRMELDEVEAKYTVLYDISENSIYTASNYKKKAYPASLTKIMTVIVALENCEDLSDTYTFTEDDITSLEEENASTAGFTAGEKVTIEDLLYGAMLPSGADATLGIANYVAGSEDAFVELMNAKVEELGLTGTHFTNASGLHDEDHYSTAMDIAMMIKYALENEDISEKFLSIISAESYTTSETDENPSGITLSSIFFQRYAGYYIDRDLDGEEDADIVGGKTGFTDESGYSVAAIYEADGDYYVCVTLKSSTADQATMDNIAVAEGFIPTYDLLEDLVDVDDEDDEDEDEDVSVVDTTPEVIDQTESAQEAEDETESEEDSSSEEDTSSVIYDDDVPG